jgi:hypothetical protein
MTRTREFPELSTPDGGSGGASSGSAASSGSGGDGAVVPGRFGPVGYGDVPRWAYDVSRSIAGCEYRTVYVAEATSKAARLMWQRHGVPPT